jgi:hypothetical protein
MKRLGFVGLLLIATAGTASAQQERKPSTNDIPADQRPPKGMCRIWLKDVPPAQQPAATDCAAAVKNCPPNGRVIFGDTEGSKSAPKSDSDSTDPKKSLPMTKGLVGKKPVPLPKPPTATGKPPEI